MQTINKVAIYIRVSTTSQAEEGYSIDEQKDKLLRTGTSIKCIQTEDFQDLIQSVQR